MKTRNFVLKMMNFTVLGACDVRWAVWEEKTYFLKTYFSHWEVLDVAAKRWWIWMNLVNLDLNGAEFGWIRMTQGRRRRTPGLWGRRPTTPRRRWWRRRRSSRQISLPTRRWGCARRSVPTPGNLHHKTLQFAAVFGPILGLFWVYFGSIQMYCTPRSRYVRQHWAPGAEWGARDVPSTAVTANFDRNWPLLGTVFDRNCRFWALFSIEKAGVSIEIRCISCVEIFSVLRLRLPVVRFY